MNYKTGSHFLIFILIAAIMATLTGCGSNDGSAEKQAAVETTQEEDAAVMPASKTDAEPAATTEKPVAAAVSFDNLPEFDAEAPVVTETWPNLAAGVLTFARAAQLPEDLLVRSKKLQFSRQMLEEQLNDAPAEMKNQFADNEFYIVEQTVTEELIKEAVLTKYNETDESKLDELVQTYIEELVEDLEVTDEELATFYAENPDMFRGAEFEAVKDQLRGFMLQQAYQQATADHLRVLGKSMAIEVNRDWAEAQSEVAMSNPIAVARASGKPSLVNFGADTCVPCQKMAPTRESIKEKYSDQLNVVYVHVNKEQILASRYGVQSIPHLIFFDKDGNEAKSHTGVMSEEEIVEVITDLGVN